MDASNPIIFYDIASGPPVISFAPNPSKTRYALNFKEVHYRTEWVELPDVASVRKKLGSDAVRKHFDGSPFYTLPVIKDPSTGAVVGDTFDIAVYLDKTYPNGPSLFPPSTIGLLAAFNTQVDAIFSRFVKLFVHGIPFNPETAEQSKADFVWRMQGKTWDDLDLRGEERAKALEAFEAALGDLAKFYRLEDGPFLAGETVTYADFIVGGWLVQMKTSLKEWDRLQSWHDGLWGKLHQALEKYRKTP
ncbi:hypothetical protein K435DRAFT_786324 [Dendrothele bispora CBS 962.96]|uniref:Uncharacterized protein n=1 Tax=Dendrothele bispora (strain CBS 962.96) TaxID=1314807 RepID=A0A4S8KRA2_DENBC|nr:hypothetical protein K435DRAFT_786324 [Dendrothele bispora CBS 962.96]